MSVFHPRLSPRPALLHSRPDGLKVRPADRVALDVRGGPHDAALRVVRSALAGLGVHRVGQPGDLTVRLVIEPGQSGGYRVDVTPREVILAGADPAGVHHAAQVFRQLLAGGPAVPGVAVADAPALRYRGSIEGFYGTPWTHRERLAHLDFLGTRRMNTYVYAPKDDPYHRELWREPYPDAELSRLVELVRRAEDNHVTLVFTVSPGLSIRYAEPADLAALLAKFDAVRDLGVTAFAVALDDIDHTVWHGAGDAAPFGSAGAAHAWLVNEVARWAADTGCAGPVQLVPTEYHGLADTPYKRDLRERLHPDVYVWWTGTGVIPATISRADAARARELFGHRLLLWDNYPVNDYLPGRVPLGDYTGRETGLSAHVDGVLCNPMNQPAMSTVALRSFADYGWNDTTFDPRRSWHAALDDLAGGDPDVLDALLAFADLNTRDDRLHHQQAPEHAAALAEVRARLAAGDTTGAGARLTTIADRLIRAPGLIRAGVDPRFAVEAEAWLAATRLWGEALAALVPVLLGDGSATAAAALAERAAALRDERRPHDATGVLVGDGVLDTFVAEVLAGS